MRFLVVTHVQHKKHNGKIYAYGPYVREMNLWFKHVDEVMVVAPIREEKPSPIDLTYKKEVDFRPVPAFSLISPLEIVKSLFKIPYVKIKLFRAMMQADHIHLRLPGNMGLIGSFFQIFFPHKKKTAKYAGNWDPKAKQPWSYRLQKKIVASPFWSKNMKVLVYGEWPGQTPNVVPFFTASYSEKEIKDIPVRPLKEPVKLIFAGALTPGKRPLLAMETVRLLKEKGIKTTLNIYGDGPERNRIEKYILENNLKNEIILHGKQDAETLKKAYQQAHFLIFPSRSEGWPKVVAEAMVWKCLPISTKISAIPYMLAYGERGSLVKPDAEEISREILFYMENPEIYKQKAEAAYRWSKQFTLEKFEEEIQKFL